MGTRGFREPRFCPATPNCQRTVHAGAILCPPHWAMIPRRLRRPLWTAWNTWLRDSTDDNWTTFEAARNDALEVIHAHT